MHYNFFPNCKNRTAAIKQICQKYDFVNYSVIGESLCKRPIEALTIGNKTDGVLMCGAVHGMEWLTTLILLKFFEECCESMRRKTIVSGFKLYRFLLRRGLTVIPCVNPDGVEIQLGGSLTAGEYSGQINGITNNTSRWQANARGVDLNHNFDAGWQALKAMEINAGITKPASTRYGGEAPFSEPETKCLADFCRGNSFRHLLAFHSQGREIYYDFGPRTPVRSYELGKLFAKSSGYQLEHPEDLAVGGGLKDWFIETFGKPAFTIEIGKGKNPLPIYSLEAEYKILLEMLCFAAAA